VRILSTVICLYFFLTSHGQPVTKTLIIDTLIYSNNTFPVEVSTTLDSTIANDYEKMDILTSTALVSDGRIIRHTKQAVNYKNYPNVVLTIQIDNSTSEVTLPLDDSGGTLTLHNIYKYNYDTIRIIKLSVFHNCNSDTLKSEIAWYRKYNTDSGSQLKQLKSKKNRNKPIAKECIPNIPHFFSITLNQQTYKITPQIFEWTYGTKWYHGHKKMSRRKERKYYQDLADGKPYVYFAAHELLYKYSLSASIDLM